MANTVQTGEQTNGQVPEPDVRPEERAAQSEAPSKLCELCVNYQNAAEALSTRSLDRDTLLRALLLRDQIDAESADLGSRSGLVERTDEALKRKARTSFKLSDNCRSLRELWKPAATVWWWNLDGLAPKLDLGLLPGLICGLSLVGTGACLAQVNTRWLSHGVEGFAVLGTGVQTLLAGVAGFALTDWGRQLAYGFYSRFAIPLSARPWLLAATTASGLVLSVGLWANLAAISQIYLSQGWYCGTHGRIAEGTELLQISAELSPTSVAPHLDLGWIYEYTKNTTEAGTEYAKAVAIDPQNPDALTLLARTDLLASPPKIDDAEGLIAELLIMDQQKAYPQDTPRQSMLARLAAWAFLLHGETKEGDITVDLPIAKEYATEAYELLPDAPENNAILAKILEKEGTLEKQYGLYLSGNSAESIRQDWIKMKHGFDPMQNHSRVLLFESIERTFGK